MMLGWLAGFIGAGPFPGCGACFCCARSRGWRPSPLAARCGIYAETQLLSYQNHGRYLRDGSSAGGIYIAPVSSPRVQRLPR